MAPLPTTWTAKETTELVNNYNDLESYDPAITKYNPTPATGATGVFQVAPNNYPFYSEEEKYVPIMQADSGQLSEWEPMYNPSADQAEKDRQAAFEKGIPHGYVAPGDKYKDLPQIRLTVHKEDEYGAQVEKNGKHRGGPFVIDVSPKMRIWDLRKIIYKEGGVIPALQKLSFADKMLSDSNRTLEHYGVAYWHNKFPHWQLKIVK